MSLLLTSPSFFHNFPYKALSPLHRYTTYKWTLSRWYVMCVSDSIRSVRSTRDVISFSLWFHYLWVIVFFHTSRKYTLWVLIRSAAKRPLGDFSRVITTYIFDVVLVGIIIITGWLALRFPRRRGGKMGLIALRFVVWLLLASLPSYFI